MMVQGTFLPYVAIKSRDVYAIKVIDLYYVAFAKGIGVDLCNGFSFLPTSPGGQIVDKSLILRTDSRFKAYLDESHLTPAGTLQGFRSLSPL